MHIVRIQRGNAPQVSLLQEQRYEKEKDLEKDLAGGTAPPTAGDGNADSAARYLVSTARG